MEPRDGKQHGGKKSKSFLRLGGSSSSKESRSFLSFFHIKHSIFRWKKVVHNKDDENKGDGSSTTATSGVGTLDKKKKLDIDEELSKMLSILEFYPKPTLIDVKDYQDEKNHTMLNDGESSVDMVYKSQELDTRIDFVNKLSSSNPVCKVSSSSNLEESTANDLNKRAEPFKRFDIVCDCSDHHYAFQEAKSPSKDLMRRILHEWKILDENLPETIFVRVYEERMDLLRAVIIGPAETPYHDGLFFFDIKFQNDYPASPPKVHFQSCGYCLNPNLYAGGKVCLSLLNTWHGNNSERWNPKMSTILQVLVSIQGLVLNGKPYFNEPNVLHKAFMKTEEEKSLSYNRKVFLKSCKLMLYSIKIPPKHFEEFVAQHFREHGRAIFAACKAYMRGATIGGSLEDCCVDVNLDYQSCSSNFRHELGLLSCQLWAAFAAKGIDCQGFNAS